MKTCTVCKTQKKLGEYPKSGKKVYARCRECAKSYSREYNRIHKDELNEKRKNYYWDHREESLNKQKKRYLEKHEEIRKRQREKAKTPEARRRASIRSLKWARENKERFNGNLKNYRERNKEKLKARQLVMWAVKLEVIKKPENCEKCNRMNTLQAHHVDHSKPLEVQWLCRICHMHQHGKLLDINPLENI